MNSRDFFKLIKGILKKESERRVSPRDKEQVQYSYPTFPCKM